MAYLNKYEKGALCVVMGFHGYMEQLLEEDRPSVRPYFKRIKTMMAYCQSMVTGMTKDLNLTQTDLLKRQIDNQRLIIVPKEDVKYRKELTILPVATVERLVRSAYNECFMCDKEKGDARDCELRRTLLEAGAIAQDNGKGVCPFKHGML